MNPNQPRAAIRSSSFLHLDEDVATAFDESQKQLDTQDDEELRALQKIAALENHPGWKLIRDQFVSDIEEYRSGRKLDMFCKDYSLSNAQIGQATRTMNLVADELTRVLNAVVIAVSEVDRQKAEQNNARSSARMGRDVKRGN